ncbi:unnamed protein product [Thelazia callipaeda]|uniref:V-SNARE coiled-coil homology domain-containing protein n=1 Tax=Thelazia callipaeda TaxID=103827 RepID=A0A0N5CMT4_THECL|nr:unnamed protein product [Thelazia callipaeda]
MDRAKKRLVSALDGFRNQHKAEIELDEKVTTTDVCLKRIVRHGFPDDPRCMAYDPVQKLLAIGTGQGLIRIIGDSGVDSCLKHESDAAGALVTACRDDLIHLWNFRQKVPEVLHSMQLTKEKVTCLSHPFQSKWLYVGTERGNVYFINVTSFTLSSYAINWNKAIDLGVRTHPGSVKAISTSPTEPIKLLILYEKGTVILWNLQTKEVDRFTSDHPARCISWHHNGRQFMCGTADGSLLIWNIKKASEYSQRLQPHGQRCRPITQVDWRHSADGEQLIIFSGGLSQDDGVLPALTIMRASKTATVLELDHPLVIFVPLSATPYTSVSQQPFSVAVLIKYDILIIDLTTPSYPCHENVNPMDIHESPVRCISYFSNCPLDLLGALALVGSKQRRQGFSDKPWPVTGGCGRDCAMDGSIKFWQASGEHLQILYKLRSGRHFERNYGIEMHEFSYAVTMIELCLDSRLLLVAAQNGLLTLFRFLKTENAQEITVINIPCAFNSLSSNEDCAKISTKKELKRQGKAISVDSNSTDTSEGSIEDGFFPMKVRGGVLRRPAGYQPDLVCMFPWINGSQADDITAIALNSAYGVIAIGTSMTLTLVDSIQYTVICSWSTADRYASQNSPSILLSSQNSSANQHELGQDTKRNLDSPPYSTVTKSAVRFNTENSRGNSDKRPQLLKSQSVTDSSYEFRDLAVAKANSTEESPSGARKALFSDSVTSLSFIQSCIKKGDLRAHLCLWVGSSTGLCIVYNLLLPADRLNSSVSVVHNGVTFQGRGRMLYTTFMDENFCLLDAAAENYRDKECDQKQSQDKKIFANRVLTKISLSPTCSNSVEHSREEFLQFVVFIHEDEVHTVALPNFSSLFSHYSEIPFVKARATHVHGYPVLMLLDGAGHIVVLSLPSLRLLHCSSLFRHSVDYDDPMCLKTSFTEHGLGMYTITPSEVQKFTICSELASQVQDSVGDLFVPVDMPELPKITDKNSNATTGNTMRSVGKTIPGPSSSMEQVTTRGISAGQAANMALQALHERGEKLNMTVEATERLKDNAMTFSQRTSKLVEKYEKKKWYNF